MLQGIDARIDAEVAKQPDRTYWKHTLRYGLRVYRVMADWADEAEAELEDPARPRRHARAS